MCTLLLLVYGLLWAAIETMDWQTTLTAFNLIVKHLALWLLQEERRVQPNFSCVSESHTFHVTQSLWTEECLIVKTSGVGICQLLWCVIKFRWISQSEQQMLTHYVLNVIICLIYFVKYKSSLPSNFFKCHKVRSENTVKILDQFLASVSTMATLTRTFLQVYFLRVLMWSKMIFCQIQTFRRQAVNWPASWMNRFERSRLLSGYDVLITLED